MAKKTIQAENDNSEPSKEPVAKAPESDQDAKSDVWTAEGTLAEQIEKQKLINEDKLKRE